MFAHHPTPASPIGGGLPPAIDRDQDGAQATPTAVYLDQNIWIKLARAAYGYVDADDARDALMWLRGLVDATLIIVPLSNAHYMETQAHYVEARRIRLGIVMVEIAKLRTLAPPKRIVAWEIDQALARRFGRPAEVSPVSVVGFGVGHAFGERLEVPVGRLLDETIDEWAQRKVQAQYIFEVGAITGVRGDGPMENLAAHNEISSRYAQGEHNLASKMCAAGITGTARDDVLLIDEIADISEVLDERLRVAQVTWSEFTALGRDGIASFLSDLPSRAVTLALRRERHRNPNERWKGGDLHDIAALSLAVAYCDIVVMEKHMHALLLRSGIAERFGTTLLRRASDLTDVLDRRFKGAIAGHPTS
jgi:hypothetical protein